MWWENTNKISHVFWQSTFLFHTLNKISRIGIYFSVDYISLIRGNFRFDLLIYLQNCKLSPIWRKNCLKSSNISCIFVKSVGILQHCYKHWFAPETEIWRPSFSSHITETSRIWAHNFLKFFRQEMEILSNNKILSSYHMGVLATC